MQVRDTVNFEYFKTMDTEALRDNFLIQGLFTPDALNFTYTHYDRMIVGGVCPTKPLKMAIKKELLGAAYLLERREMGVINVGGSGTITVDDKPYVLEHEDALYIGKGAKDIVFSSANPKEPAKFYVNSTPAHASFPTTEISIKTAQPQHMGEVARSNKRTIYKFIHADGVKSAQLVMGMTLFDPPSVWNTMPCHTHMRRIEAYFYFDIPADEIVFHLMGKPEETRHIAVRNEEVVLSPSWSIHSGVGTFKYSFIWGMAGENQTFSDMDAVSMKDIR